MDQIKLYELVFMGCVIAGGVVFIDLQCIVLKELQKQTSELQSMKQYIVNIRELTNSRLKDVNLDLARHTLLFKEIGEELRIVAAVIQKKGELI